MNESLDYIFGTLLNVKRLGSCGLLFFSPVLFLLFPVIYPTPFTMIYA